MMVFTTIWECGFPIIIFLLKFKFFNVLNRFDALMLIIIKNYFDAF